MLVLSRKPGTSIIIDDVIEVIVLSITAGHVNIGITAPSSVSVHRREVHAKIKAGKGKQKGGHSHG